MEHFFVYNGESSADFGVWISGGGTYNAPSRDVTTEVIPGRNGTLSFDNGRYNNVLLAYPAFISRRFQPRVDDFRAWLQSQTGYQRLEDSYHPDEFRLALYHSSFEVSTSPRNIAGTFDIVFDCKPQRFLKSGEQTPLYESGDVIYNPTRYEALPLIMASGNGTLTLNGTTITVSGNSGRIYIDCDLQDAYYGSTNKNAFITPNFPTLAPGQNTITFSGLTAVRVRPRWWTL